MSSFKVERTPTALAPFQVRGADGAPAAEINEFLLYLAACGRSAYTLHSYATALAHFFGWLRESGKGVDDTRRHVVEQYIAAFSRTPKYHPGGRRVPQPSPVEKDGRTGSSHEGRRPRTINHRLSVLASYFTFRIRQDQDRGSGAWFQRDNPISAAVGTDGRHGLTGRDRPPRGRAGEFRRRVPREIHQTLDPFLAEQLIGTAVSYRDKSILTLLFRTAQRIGDWSDVAGRHGVLGMVLTDIDERRRTITVRLKGDRDEHRVPVTEDFWPLFHRYLAEERGTTTATPAAWLGLRRGKGKPLTYTAFESSLRYVSRKTGISVHAHLFRHTLAQAVMETTGNLKVAQELLGHAQISTTADLYMHVDHDALVKAVRAVKSTFDHTKSQASGILPTERPAEVRYAFAYDQTTIEELEKAATQSRSAPGGRCGNDSESADIPHPRSGESTIRTR
ncbi:MAG TPA: tyrosine-type recombinase/integrase [Terriglobia bacterium]|nr:tyrosine-type recombinase/integrase [Terriglobia bacterium]